MIATKSVKPALQLAYVKLMMDIIGRGLVMASQVDPEIKQEVAQFPANFRLSMNVFRMARPSLPGSRNNISWNWSKSNQARPDHYL